MTITNTENPLDDLNNLSILALDCLIDLVLNEQPEDLIKILWEDIDPDDHKISKRHKWKAVRYFTINPGIINVGKTFRLSDPHAGIELEVIDVGKLKKIQNLVTTQVNSILVAEQKLSMKKDFDNLLNQVQSSKYNENSDNKTPSHDEKVLFNNQNGVIIYGSKRHAFHKGKSEDLPRLKLFKFLWEFRKYFVNGKFENGESKPDYFCAIQAGITQDKHSYQRSEESQNKFKELIKGFNKNMRSPKTNLPIKIEIKGGGVQIVVNN